jgi:pimeloyl-ACP methyl ester carboxylesterase
MPVKQGWKYTTLDFAGDVKAAIDFLFTENNIDTSFIGIIGHSEGGVIAPMVASEDKRVKFIISLAGTGLSGYQIASSQAKDLASNSRELIFSKKSLETIVNEPDIKKRKRKLWEINSIVYGKLNLASKYNLYFTIDMAVSEWNRFFINYNPSNAWQKVLCPVLALFGEYDIQVLPAENLQAIEEALIISGNTDYSLVTIPKANHLFQTVENGGPKDYKSLLKEYNESEQTISPAVLKKISDWIIERYTKKFFRL